MAKAWNFYGRHEELQALQGILDRARFFFCEISGRRRIGKTELIHEALKRAQADNAIYFQVPDSDPAGVVRDFRVSLAALRNDLGDRVLSDFDLEAEVTNLREVTDMILTLIEVGHIVVIDEFQYLLREDLRPLLSYLQGAIDIYRRPALSDEQMGGLFVLGSIQTEMSQILQDRSSPLFHRTTDNLAIRHWDFQSLLDMFVDQEIRTAERWLFLWSMFEGVPKFYRDANAFNALSEASADRGEVLNRLFFSPNSPLREEGDTWFRRELRGRYDVILKTLADSGPSSHADILAACEADGDIRNGGVAAYLRDLSDRYGLVERREPILAEKRSRQARYAIADNFLGAWLSSLAAPVRMTRVRPVEAGVAAASERLETWEGHAFERWVRLILEECSRKNAGDFPLTEVARGYWDRGDIEIDIVAMNEDERVVRFGSCKRSASKHDADSLRGFETHIARFLETKRGRKLSGWKIERALYSPAFSTAQRKFLGSRGYLTHDLYDFAGMLRPGFRRPRGQ